MNQVELSGNCLEVWQSLMDLLIQQEKPFYEFGFNADYRILYDCNDAYYKNNTNVTDFLFAGIEFGRTFSHLNYMFRWEDEINGCIFAADNTEELKDIIFSVLEKLLNEKINNDINSLLVSPHFVVREYAKWKCER